MDQMKGVIRPTNRPSPRCVPSTILLWRPRVSICEEHRTRSLPPSSELRHRWLLHRSSEVREVWAEILMECRTNSRKTCITTRDDVRLLKLNKEGSLVSASEEKTYWFAKSECLQLPSEEALGMPCLIQSSKSSTVEAWLGPEGTAQTEEASMGQSMEITIIKYILYIWEHNHNNGRKLRIVPAGTYW